VFIDTAVPIFSASIVTVPCVEAILLNKVLVCACNSSNLFIAVALIPPPLWALAKAFDAPGAATISSFEESSKKD